MMLSQFYKIKPHIIGSAFSRPNNSGNTKGQFSAPGRAKGPAPLPPMKMTDLVTKFEAICVIFGRFPPKFREILHSGLPRILCKWGKSMAIMNNEYSSIFKSSTPLLV